MASLASMPERLRLIRLPAGWSSRLRGGLWLGLRWGAWPVFWQTALFVTVLALAMIPAIRMLPLPSHPEQDMSHFRYWIAWLTQNGVTAAYAGKFPAQYVIYPPLTPYFFHLVGQVLALFPAPPDALLPYWPADGHWIEAVIRTPVVLFQALLCTVIYWSTVRWKGHRWAIVATALYAANPAVLFDLVYWAQPDSYHAFFAVVALLALLGRWPEVGWSSMAIAAMAKPQAWIYLPVLLLVTWRRHGLGKVLSGGVFFVLTLIPIIWPFVTADRFWELASVFVNFSRVMPVVTANAHNFWWLVMGQDGLAKADTALFIGPFSYQTVGFVLLLAGYSAALMKLLGDGDRKTLFSSAGMMSLVFFLFATQIHENHAFLIFPMLAMCLVADWRLFAVYVLLTVTMLGNLALHDPILEPLAPGWLAEYLPLWLPAGLRDAITLPNLDTAGALLNFAALGIWLTTFAWGGPTKVTARERQTRAAWGAAVGGATALAGVALALYLLLAPVQPAAESPDAADASILGGKISLEPVDEPYHRITEGGGGTTDPDARRAQTIATAAGGAAAVALVSLGFAGYQGISRRQH